MITTAGKSSTIKGCVEHSKFSANYAWKPNLVVFHNVVSMTRVLQDLIDAGYVVTPEIIARLSPAKTEHINRFGHYDLRFDRMPLPITEELRLSPAPGKVEPLCWDFTQFFAGLQIGPHKMRTVRYAGTPAGPGFLEFSCTKVVWSDLV